MVEYLHRRHTIKYSRLNTCTVHTLIKYCRLDTCTVHTRSNTVDWIDVQYIHDQIHDGIGLRYIHQIEYMYGRYTSSVLQCFVVCCSVTASSSIVRAVCCIVLQCVAVLQCDALCCSVLQHAAVCCSLFHCFAVFCCALLRCGGGGGAVLCPGRERDCFYYIIIV